MLKKRLIPVQLLNNRSLVKSINFDNFREVGNPITSSKIYNDSDTDEIIFLNINRDNRSINPLLNYLNDLTEVCFMPISVGGGIKKLKDVEDLIINGADKIILNSIAYKNYDLIKEIKNNYGKQSIIISIDVKKDFENSDYSLFSNCGKNLEEISLNDHILKCQDYGAGEIFINSIDNDGKMSGMDVNLINYVSSISDVPVIACGGVGNYEDLKKIYTTTNVSAIACGSLFNFGDYNPIRAKAYLKNYEIPLKIL